MNILIQVFLFLCEQKKGKTTSSHILINCSGPELKLEHVDEEVNALAVVVRSTSEFK